jgi:hypothetical protein
MRTAATINPNAQFILHASAQFSATRRSPVVLGDCLTADEAFALIDADKDEEYDDFLLCGDDGQVYIPDFRKRAWVVAAR